MANGESRQSDHAVAFGDPDLEFGFRLEDAQEDRVAGAHAEFGQSLGHALEIRRARKWQGAAFEGALALDAISAATDELDLEGRRRRGSEGGSQGHPQNTGPEPPTAG